MHTIEKIGGTSMSDYSSVRDNIILSNQYRESPYQRIFVVSAYSGVTNKLLEHKTSGEPGIYALFSESITNKSWLKAFKDLEDFLFDINASLFKDKKFKDKKGLQEANEFIDKRLKEAKLCLENLHKLCLHGHFALDAHLSTVREMLASIGEAHSAWNTAYLLKADGLNTCFVDLTGWQSTKHMSLDERILSALEGIDLSNTLAIVTGYAHSETGLMSTFNRGYSEMIFSRLAVLTKASEAIIHKEFHLSSADPRLVGEDKAVPIGRTNYDVADQLANLGMEAIHPKAAKGLRQNNIPLRVKNTFEPDHAGTLITRDYVSETPRVEIIAGCKGIYAFEVFDQNMSGNMSDYDAEILSVIKRFKGSIISKDVNANTITHFLNCNLKTIKRITNTLQERYPESEIKQQKIAIVSAIGSDMKITGILAKTVQAMANLNISVLAVHQAMRQVDMQFIVHESDYENAVKSLHQSLVEIHNHGSAICLAS